MNNFIIAAYLRTNVFNHLICDMHLLEFSLSDITVIIEHV